MTSDSGMIASLFRNSYFDRISNATPYPSDARISRGLYPDLFFLVGLFPINGKY